MIPYVFLEMFVCVCVCGCSTVQYLYFFLMSCFVCGDSVAYICILCAVHVCLMCVWRGIVKREGDEKRRVLQVQLLMHNDLAAAMMDTAMGYTPTMAKHTTKHGTRRRSCKVQEFLRIV